MRHQPTTAIPHIGRRGVTLLELIVVIALLGLVLAVAAPSFILPGERRDSGITALLANARHAAILRGEPVTVAVEADGAWRIGSDPTPTAPAIAAGKLDSPVEPLRVHVSPLGTCVADATNSDAAVDWSPLDCRFVAAAAVPTGPAR